MSWVMWLLQRAGAEQCIACLPSSGLQWVQCMVWAESSSWTFRPIFLAVFCDVIERETGWEGVDSLGDSMKLMVPQDWLQG